MGIIWWNFVILLECDGLGNYEEFLKVENVPFNKIESNGIDGELVSGAFLITLSTASITAVTRVIVELIRARKKPKIVFKGKDMSAQFEGLEVHEIKDLLESINKE